MTERDLPPLAPPGASDRERGRAIAARMAARYGAPTLADFRRAYAGFGAEWPGDEEIRRRHIVADAPPLAERDEQVAHSARSGSGTAPHSAV